LAGPWVGKLLHMYSPGVASICNYFQWMLGSRLPSMNVHRLQTQQ